MTDSNDKNNLEVAEEKQEAPRARNRTVMLSSDVTGEMRARLADDFAEDENPTQVRNTLPTSEPKIDSGFSKPMQASGVTLSPPTMDPVEEKKATTASLGDEARLRNSTYNPATPPASPPPSVAFGVPVATPDLAPKQEAPSSPAQTPQHLQRTIPMASPPVAAAPTGDRIEWSKESPVLGFLVSYDKDENGQVFELRGGRLIVTSETSAGGSFLLLSDESISPMHAILKAGTNGEVQVLDQLSENGTEIKSHESGKTESLSGDKGIVKHGDIVSFGDRSFHICLVTRD